MFETFAPPPVDALMEIGRLFRADSRVDKLDLGIGVYPDGRGQVPIMFVVKKVEERIRASQTSKGYLGPEGDPVFAERRQTAVRTIKKTLTPKRTVEQTRAWRPRRVLGAVQARSTEIRRAPERRSRIRPCLGRPGRTGPQTGCRYATEI